jgi:hypothetical protein
VVVEDDHAERRRRGLGEELGRVGKLCAAYAAGLLQPGPDGVQPDDEERLRSVDRLGCLPVTLELRKGLREARDRRVRDVVVARDGEDRPSEAAEEARGPLVLLRTAAVGQVATRDDQLGIHALDQGLEPRLQARLFMRSDVEVREVNQSRRGPGHSRGRLYTQIVVDEPTEIFDDLYLGLRAGGALRKKRRGEPLTTDEEEALGRWQRLSKVRKAVTLGAFSLGTFGLGFTIGGLIFGKWRRA